MADILSYDPMTGIKTTFDFDEGTGQALIGTHQNVEGILEYNKAMASTDAFRGQDNDFWHVAEIPIGVQYEWLTKYGVDLMKEEHWPAVQKLLNSSDYRYLKCAEVII